MTICEFRFETFNARGTDAYLERTAARFDRLLQSRWALLDAQRERDESGWWSVCFYRESADYIIAALNRR